MKPAPKTVIVGTRGSRLALAQTGQVLKALRRKNPGVRFEARVIKTTGDEYQTVELFKKTNIGVFTKELEKKLLSGEIDAAVHSLKDLPTDLPKQLTLASFPKREDTRDALISRQRFTLKSLPQGALVATGSPRRKRQLEILRPDLKIKNIRGNLDTRIGRVLKTGEFHVVMLAQAGLLRLGRYLKYAVAVPASAVLPAVGQAALALEARAGDRAVLNVLAKINHVPTAVCVTAERSFLKKLRGGCRVPVGVESKIKGGKLHLRAFVFSTKTDRWISGEITGSAAQPEKTGENLAKKLLSRGAAKFMREARVGENVS